MITKSLRLALIGGALMASMGAASAQPYPPPPPQPPIAPVPPPPPPALEPCRADVQRFCQGILPGAGRIRACIQANRDRLSPECRSGIMQVIERRREVRQQRQQMRQQWRQGIVPPPPGPPPPPPPPKTMAPVPN